MHQCAASHVLACGLFERDLFSLSSLLSLRYLESIRTQIGPHLMRARGAGAKSTAGEHLWDRK